MPVTGHKFLIMTKSCLSFFPSMNHASDPVSKLCAAQGRARFLLDGLWLCEVTTPRGGFCGRRVAWLGVHLCLCVTRCGSAVCQRGDPPCTGLPAVCGDQLVCLASSSAFEPSPLASVSPPPPLTLPRPLSRRKPSDFMLLSQNGFGIPPL